MCVCVCDGGDCRLQAGSKCKHLQLHYDTLVFDDGNDCRAHKVILMNPVESRRWAGSECRHPYLHCILQLLTVVDVQDGQGLGVK